MSVSSILEESTATSSVVLTFVIIVSISDLLLLVSLVHSLIPVSKLQEEGVPINSEIVGLQNSILD